MPPDWIVSPKLPLSFPGCPPSSDALTPFYTILVTLPTKPCLLYEPYGNTPGVWETGRHVQRVETDALQWELSVLGAFFLGGQTTTSTRASTATHVSHLLHHPALGG